MRPKTAARLMYTYHMMAYCVARNERRWLRNAWRSCWGWSVRLLTDFSLKWHSKCHFRCHFERNRNDRSCHLWNRSRIRHEARLRKRFLKRSGLYREHWTRYGIKVISSASVPNKIRNGKCWSKMGMSMTENVELKVLCLIEDGDAANWSTVWTPASTAGSGLFPLLYRKAHREGWVLRRVLRKR